LILLSTLLSHIT